MLTFEPWGMQGHPTWVGTHGRGKSMRGDDRDAYRRARDCARKLLENDERCTLRDLVGWRFFADGAGRV